MTFKLVKISLLSLLSYLFICLFAPNFVFADEVEEAFIKECSNRGGNYTIKSYSDLTSNPCAAGDEQIYSLGLTLDNIFCCKGTNGLPGEDGDGEIPEEFRLNISVNHLKNSSLKEMNPLRGSVLGTATPGEIINRALSTVVFPIAGIGMLILILMGGFQIITASMSGKQNYLDVGKRQVTAAIIGFVLLFLVYWIWRALTLATGLSI